MTPSQALMMLQGPALRQLSKSYAAGHLAAANKVASPHGPWVRVLE
jgi:hypothetical protein